MLTFVVKRHDATQRQRHRRRAANRVQNRNPVPSFLIAVLQQTDADRSQWMDIPSATSPYSVPFTETRFYRLRQK